MLNIAKLGMPTTYIKSAIAATAVTATHALTHGAAGTALANNQAGTMLANVTVFAATFVAATLTQP